MEQLNLKIKEPFMPWLYRGRVGLPASVLRPGKESSWRTKRELEDDRKGAAEVCNCVTHENRLRETARDVMNCGDWLARQKAETKRKSDQLGEEFGI